MDYKELSDKIQKVAEVYSNDFDVKYDADWFVMKLQEELGEMTQQHLILTNRTRRKSEDPQLSKEVLAEEIADVFCYSILLANELDIDLEKAVEKKWFKFL